MTLTRKVARAKWEKREGLVAGEIPADALGDIRTHDNSLSLWRAQDDDGLDQAALALAARAERVEKIELVMLDEATVAEAGFELINTAGDTPVAELRDRHADIPYLDARRLTVVAGLVADALSHDRHRLFTVADVRKLVIDAVIAGRVGEEDLNAKLRQELATRIAAARQQQQ